MDLVRLVLPTYCCIDRCVCKEESNIKRKSTIQGFLNDRR